MRINAGKFGILERKRRENTTVKMTIYARGLRSDQRKPRTEFLYRSLKSFFANTITMSR